MNPSAEPEHPRNSSVDLNELDRLRVGRGTADLFQTIKEARFLS